MKRGLKDKKGLLNKLKYLILIFPLFLFLGCNDEESPADPDPGDEEVNGNGEDPIDDPSDDEPDPDAFEDIELDVTEAEVEGLEVETDTSGYTGEGYVGGWEEDGQYVQFTVDIPAEDEYTLVFRYGGGAGSASRQLSVNDENFLDEVRFSGSGNWGNWQTVPVYEVPLNEGENKITLNFDSDSASSNWLNLDQLVITQIDRVEEGDFGDFDAYSEEAQAVMEDLFWNEGSQQYISQYPEDVTDDMFHYWWAAHALDVLVDAYERSGNEDYLDRASALYAGVLNRNGGEIPNDFYDDMLWMALALMRLYEHTGETEYEEAVFTLWEDILTGWNDEQGGGIAWQKHQLDYKNTPSNAPAVILAARLYQEYGDEEYLQWANDIYEWQTENLVDPEDGFVWDGVNREGDGEIDYDWHFTYNQGVYIGAAIEMYNVTGEEEYIEAARQTAETAKEHFSNHNDIVYEGDSGDGGLFKGIMIRYMTELVEVDENQEELSEWIQYNAAYAYRVAERQDDLLFGASWESNQETAIELSQQLSGIKLMEQAAKLAE